MARGRRPGRVIDFKQWTAAPGLISTISTATTFSSGALSFTSPATILRVRGYVQAMFDATKAAGDRLILTWGLGIVSTDAFTAGAGSLPDPASEPEYPWMWWGEMRLESQLAGPDGDAWGTANQRLEVDTKGMRRVKPGQTMVMVGQSTNVAGAPATLIDVGQMRTLIGT